MPSTVLVVEDDRLNMRLFHDLLTCEGFDTLEAMNGETALELARDTRPDLVLLDIQLPGMSGLDVVRRFKEERRLGAIPIIAVTALALKSHESLIRASGVDAYVTKPFSVAELMRLVRSYLPTDPLPSPDAEDADAEPAPPWTVAPDFSLHEPEG
jgi:two-component system, cell cycle response regulator DivK